jgi:hypothetical protein
MWRHGVAGIVNGINGIENGGNEKPRQIMAMAKYLVNIIMWRNQLA